MRAVGPNSQVTPTLESEDATARIQGGKAAIADPRRKRGSSRRRMQYLVCGASRCECLAASAAFVLEHMASKDFEKVATPTAASWQTVQRGTPDLVVPAEGALLNQRSAISADSGCASSPWPSRASRA
mmetsp:Transcript_50539/g.141526  ORF Transcript_50539/g.141526 Transcript_50539/m.141526 type:complete len:128 (-) Transcript_50539:1062-1445(-)